MRLLPTLLTLSALLPAADLTVVVSNIQATKGQVACAVFPSSEGFPMEASKARGQRHPAQPGSVECRFPDLPPGTYAVAVSIDTNNNGKTDRNFVGMPTEAWGVSNNVRPSLRAPKFDEAKFELKESQRIEIKVSK